MFDETAHTRLRDTAPPKDLHRIPCCILRTSCAVHLQESDLAGEVGSLFLVRLEYKYSCHSQTRIASKNIAYHIAHLVRDILKPRLYGFCARDHRSQLRADDRLRAKWLAERLAL